VDGCDETVLTYAVPLLDAAAVSPPPEAACELDGLTQQ